MGGETPYSKQEYFAESQISMASVPIQKAAGYAVADAVISLRLAKLLSEELDKVSARELFDTMEMPLVPVLAEMERAGIRLDLDFFGKFSQELETDLAAIEDKIYKLVGEPFNINSTQ